MSANTFNPQASQAPASNTDAVCTMSAPTDGSGWSLGCIPYSYSGMPTNGKLTLAWTVNSVNYTEIYYVTVSGRANLIFPQTRKFPPNTAVVATLVAGGSGVFGTIYPQAVTVI